MSGQAHPHKRRSLSIFSLDHFRSLSRTSARPERVETPRPPLRSPSSLSCDPYSQPPTTPKSKGGDSPAVVDDVVKTPTTDASSRMPFARLRHSLSRSSNTINQRPRSWFSFPRPSFGGLPTRSFSIQLPKDTSASSVERGAISAPVLTGTTNMTVAEAEGVCCRDIVDAGLTTQVERVKIREESVSTEDLSFPGDDSIIRHLSQAPSTGESRGDKVKSLIFDGPLSETEPKSEDTWRFSAVERGIARRRAETLNLCREKINKLTGHGRIKRKSINNNVAGSTSGHVEGPGNHDTTGTPASLEHHTKQTKFLTHDEQSNLHDSLTRSFTSAIDKLDFRSPTPDKMSFIKSKSSLFNIKKKAKPADNGAGKLIPDPRLVEAAKRVPPPFQDPGSDLVGAPPQPMQFSAASNDYVPAKSEAQYPRGVRALGMHSNVMEFAKAPEWVTDLPTPPTHTPTLDEVLASQVEEDGEEEDEDEEGVIEDAPIYSPSLGDLSQYARPSPSAAQSCIEPERSSAPATPTQLQSEKSYMRRLGLRKSKSGLGLLSMFNKGQKDAVEQKVPLQARDRNKSVRKEPVLKKSRSMNLTGLLKKSGTVSVKEPLLQESREAATQPGKPSPLRYETVMDDEPISRGPGLYQAQKRAPPRGNVTPSERAKRMGVVGMPKATPTDHDHID